MHRTKNKNTNKNTKQKLIELEGETENSAIIVDFILLSVIHAENH